VMVSPIEIAAASGRFGAAAGIPMGGCVRSVGITLAIVSLTPSAGLLTKAIDEM
jgi:hypothetical protein